MPKARRHYPSLQPKDRDVWRAWLEKNHASSDGVWVVYEKKSHNAARLMHTDAVDEAICFGWIDSVANPLDEKRYKQLFTPRKPKSVWSAISKRRVDDMIAARKMTAAGLASIEVAKANGSWTKIDAVEALEMPDDFARKLTKGARANFDAWPPSARKMMLHWINNAKREETRRKRVKVCAAGAKANERMPWAPAKPAERAAAKKPAKKAAKRAVSSARPRRAR
jgi:uncharacterized protein YdeI (YjbR/CyaY-like superfamily)